MVGKGNQEIRRISRAFPGIQLLCNVTDRE